MHIPRRGETSTEDDTADLPVSDQEFVTSCTKFRYLGSLITWDLDDTADINARIGQGHGAFNHMANVLLNKKVNIHARARAYQALVANVVLWGCDSWAANQSHFKALDVFQNICVRRMFGLHLCADYHVSMEEACTSDSV